MSDAGLTNGALAAHFSSKDALVAEAVAREVRAQAALFHRAADHPDGLERVLSHYLSLAHRDDQENGCVSAALLGEIVRAAPDVRARYADALDDVVAAFRRLLGAGPEVPDALVIARLGILVGTLQFARVVPDARLADDILREGAEQLRSLQGLPHRR